MIKIFDTFTEDQIEMFRKYGAHVYTPNGTYMYMPFWIRVVEHGIPGQVELLTPERLPKNVVDMINDMREKILPKKFKIINDLYESDTRHSESEGSGYGDAGEIH